jgi:hypothetical protein
VVRTVHNLVILLSFYAGHPLDIAPPLCGTILGGTGSFEGTEGTVGVVTIVRSSGPIPTIDNGLDGWFEGWFKVPVL